HGVWRSVEGAAGWRVVVRFPAGPRSQGACALFPYTPLFRSQVLGGRAARALAERGPAGQEQAVGRAAVAAHVLPTDRIGAGGGGGRGGPQGQGRDGDADGQAGGERGVTHGPKVGGFRQPRKSARAPRVTCSGSSGRPRPRAWSTRCSATGP